MTSVLRRQIRYRAKTFPPSNQHNTKFVDVWRVDVLSPAAHDLVCRKKADSLDSRSYLPPNSSLRGVPCCQTPRSMKLLIIRLTLAVSTTSCRHPIQLLLSGFGEIMIYCNNVRRTKLLALLLENGVEPPPYKNVPASDTIARFQTNLPRSNARRPSGNGQARRRPVQPPGSNTRVCLDFVSVAFFQQERASWLKFARPVLFLVFSSRIHKRGGVGKMALIVVEAVPAAIKPPAADNSMRTSTGVGDEALTPQRL